MLYYVYLHTLPCTNALQLPTQPGAGLAVHCASIKKCANKLVSIHIVDQERCVHVDSEEAHQPATSWQRMEGRPWHAIFTRTEWVWFDSYSVSDQEIWLRVLGVGLASEDAACGTAIKIVCCSWCDAGLAYLSTYAAISILSEREWSNIHAQLSAAAIMAASVFMVSYSQPSECLLNADVFSHVQVHASHSQPHQLI